VDYPECDGSDSVKQRPPDQTKLFKITDPTTKAHSSALFYENALRLRLCFSNRAGRSQGAELRWQKGEWSECLIANQMNLENGYK
jgi:hypothetical protein